MISLFLEIFLNYINDSQGQLNQEFCCLKGLDWEILN